MAKRLTPKTVAPPPKVAQRFDLLFCFKASRVGRDCFILGEPKAAASRSIPKSTIAPCLASRWVFQSQL